jgi:hypothetical protein
MKNLQLDTVLSSFHLDTRNEMTQVAYKYPNKLSVQKARVMLDYAHVGGVDHYELHIPTYVHAEYKAVVEENVTTAASEHSSFICAVCLCLRIIQ